MNIPSNLYYTKEHEWIRVEGNEAFVGITDYAQSELGEIVFVDINTEGETLAQGDVFGSVEAVKTVSDLNMPVTGEVLEINEAINDQPEVLILRMGKVPFIDTTGEEYLRNIVRNFQATGGTLLVTGVHPTLRAILEANGLAQEIGKERFFYNTGDAIDEAIRHIQFSKCIGCKHFAFKECEKLSKGEQPEVKINYIGVTN